MCAKILATSGLVRHHAARSLLCRTSLAGMVRFEDWGSGNWGSLSSWFTPQTEQSSPLKYQSLIQPTVNCFIGHIFMLSNIFFVLIHVWHWYTVLYRLIILMFVINILHLNPRYQSRYFTVLMMPYI